MTGEVCTRKTGNTGTGICPDCTHHVSVHLADGCAMCRAMLTGVTGQVESLQDATVPKVPSALGTVCYRRNTGSIDTAHDTCSDCAHLMGNHVHSGCIQCRDALVLQTATVRQDASDLEHMEPLIGDKSFHVGSAIMALVRGNVDAAAYHVKQEQRRLQGATVNKGDGSE